ncbi:uncharacterized protein LOC116288817 isoform X2 [Actinia tenebrosa]|uniref:Uncharacterized protein LOC116288817 isoform X2 n=1 Tax=Actinia tenebrosa TaxID=6105 RepID=A0A6P8HG16_ACTTE|nr:uncharacterized protein LOC116288817 isoform X2 [Actinia tenebrosa]
MVMRTNLHGDLPVETAMQYGHDDVAASLIKKMSHLSVQELFRASKAIKAKNDFVELVRQFKMKKTILAILDAMIVPKWPYPTSLHYHNTTVGEWQDLEDHPTHIQVCCDLLDVDKNGRPPSHPDYIYCPKSPFYYLTQQCQTLQKDLIFHPVLRLVSERKWEKYARFWFRFRFLNYCVFVFLLAIAIMSLVANPNKVTLIGVFSRNYAQNIFFTWLLLMSLWFLLDEISEFRREPSQYIRDWTNYWDISRNVILIITIFIRITESHNPLFWYVAVFAIFMNLQILIGF